MTTSELERLTVARRLASTGEGRRRRQDADLSLREIAEACGVDTGTVWKWETGCRRPRGDAALRYAAVIEMIGKAP